MFPSARCTGWQKYSSRGETNPVIPWGDKPCHQICLYYDITLNSDDTPKEGRFTAQEHIEGRKFDIEFHWISIDEVKNITVYPANAAKLLDKLNEGVQHFVYKEE